MAYNYWKDLQVYPQSGLSFPWAELQTDPVMGSSSHVFGPDGVSVVMKMLIRWEDIIDACVELLGYSWRDTSTLTSRGTPFLRRELPWQHPLFNQLYVKRISELRGVRHQGKTDEMDEDVMPVGSGTGDPPNTGPTTDYELAELTIHFWRPPYYVLSDQAILDPTDNTNPREWMRYVSKTWEQSNQMLSRENSTFAWLPGVKPQNSSALFTGSVGQVVTHFRVSRTWYQIPEAALFNTISGGTPDGQPGIVYTIRMAENPLSLFFAALPTTMTTVTTQTTINSTATTVQTQKSTVVSTVPTPGGLLATTGYTYPAGSPMGGCVNAPIGGGRAVDAAGAWVDSTVASRLWGCRTGTLRFDGVTFTPQPLQLPPSIMHIPMIGNVEPLSQRQYDVTFHFDLFEPIPGPLPSGLQYGTPICGHNLFPYSGNGLWYPIISQKDLADGTAGPFQTPFHYADLSDLFYIL